jgi:monothiol glutaredoxin
MNDTAITTRIEQVINQQDIVLFMKGSKKIPQCGFSGTVIAIMERLGIADYLDVNVLKDPEIREGIKQFSNWPTIPQLYIKGEFIGGCDIIREMYEAGELQSLLAEKNIPFTEEKAA